MRSKTSVVLERAALNLESPAIFTVCDRDHTRCACLSEVTGVYREGSKIYNHFLSNLSNSERSKTALQVRF